MRWLPDVVEVWQALQCNEPGNGVGVGLKAFFFLQEKKKKKDLRSRPECEVTI